MLAISGAPPANWLFDVEILLATAETAGAMTPLVFGVIFEVFRHIDLNNEADTFDADMVKFNF